MDRLVHYVVVGRQREFDEGQAVAAATELFWTHGFEATSMRMLLDAMRLSKSSFYQAFESKDVLFKRCVNEYADALVCAMRETLAEADDGLAFVRTILVSVSDDAKSPETRRGCLVMNTANEFGQRRPSIAEVITRHVGRFEKVFEQALRLAEADGVWCGTRSRRATARFLVAALSGLKTMAKAGASRAELRESAEVAMLAL